MATNAAKRAHLPGAFVTYTIIFIKVTNQFRKAKYLTANCMNKSGSLAKIGGGILLEIVYEQE